MLTRAAPAIFDISPETSLAYRQLIDFASGLGDVTVELKKTCAHVNSNGAAFLGVHPRKSGLRITVVLSREVDSPRVVKCDRASARRYYVDLNLSTEYPLDDDIKSWIREAHGLRTEDRKV